MHPRYFDWGPLEEVDHEKAHEMLRNMLEDWGEYISVADELGLGPVVVDI